MAQISSVEGGRCHRTTGSRRSPRWLWESRASSLFTVGWRLERARRVRSLRTMPLTTGQLAADHIPWTRLRPLLAILQALEGVHGDGFVRGVVGDL